MGMRGVRCAAAAAAAAAAAVEAAVEVAVEAAAVEAAVEAAETVEAAARRAGSYHEAHVLELAATLADQTSRRRRPLPGWP